MECMTHTDILAKWKRTADFAADLGIQYGTAKAIRRRGFIPPSYWSRLVAAASERGFSGVTLKALADLAEQRKAS